MVHGEQNQQVFRLITTTKGIDLIGGMAITILSMILIFMEVWDLAGDLAGAGTVIIDLDIIIIIGDLLIMVEAIIQDPIMLIILEDQEVPIPIHELLINPMV